MLLLQSQNFYFPQLHHRHSTFLMFLNLNLYLYNELAKHVDHDLIKSEVIQYSTFNIFFFLTRYFGDTHRLMYKNWTRLLMYLLSIVHFSI